MNQKSNIKCQMSIRFLSERTSGAPPVIFKFDIEVVQFEDEMEKGAKGGIPKNIARVINSPDIVI